jgi:7-carboxy-7-deazaguanine synthase
MWDVFIYLIMKINEIFYSIQGEGKWTGLPNIFIRTTGCNLRCSYCDTKYAYYDGNDMSIDEIIKKISKYSCKNVCITGGEPLLQKDIYKLIEILLKNKYNICLETNGSKNIEKIPENKSIIISLDIKCPSSRMHKNNYLNNIHLLKNKDQIKFVIGNKDDYNFSKVIINKYKPICDVFFQPVWGTDPNILSKWIIKDNLEVILGLQLHKILWGEIKGK